jgi:exonuclease III
LADVPHVRQETLQVRPEVPDNPGEVSHVQQEPGDDRRETDDGQLKGALRGSEKEETNIPLGREFRCGSECTGIFLAAKEKQKSEKSMKLLTWNACRLLAGGRELALVNLLQATEADIATISECEIPEGTGELSVAGYTTFTPPPSAGGKTGVLILVENSLAVRANVKVITDIMDPAVQLVWLHFSHHIIGSGSGSATLGAFVLGGIYREWTPLLNRSESLQRLQILLSQMSKAAEHGARVVIHGDFNLDLDRSDNNGYYMGAMLTSLSECTTSAGLETHCTGPTFRLFGSFRPPRGGDQPPPGDPLSPAGDLPSPTGDGTRPAGGEQSPAGSGQSPAGDGADYHKYSRLDHVYTKGLISESVVLPNSKTDHRPVVTTVRAGNHIPGAEKLVSLKRRNFKALTRPKLEGALNLTDWTKVYDIKDVHAVLEYITAGIISALNIVASEKAIR